MKAEGKHGSAVAVALVVFLAVVAAFLLLSGERSSDGGKAQGPETAAGTSGYTVIITAEAQRIDGITTEPLRPRRYLKRVPAYGKVLPPEGLNASSKSYVTALAGLEKAKAALNASEKEYARMKVLNESSKNVSDRSLQAAAAQLAADRAEEVHARITLQSSKDAASLEWGPVLSEWIFDYSPSLRRLLEVQDVLVQITLSPAAQIRGIPKEVRIEPPAGGPVSAKFVSRSTRIDPKIQGISFIYIASGASGHLVPGMDVTAEMPSGGVEKGFYVPLSAVVWFQDRAWVYIKKSETGFKRVEVPTSSPVKQGYFISGIFSPGDRLVVTGAQALLSEESTPKGAGGGEEEDED